MRGQLPALAAQTQRLSAAVDAGDRQGAEAAWLVAHLQYERLGAAYGAFGDLDAAINGLPNGLPKEFTIPDGGVFTGWSTDSGTASRWPPCAP